MSVSACINDNKTTAFCNLQGKILQITLVASLSLKSHDSFHYYLCFKYQQEGDIQKDETIRFMLLAMNQSFETHPLDSERKI